MSDKKNIAVLMGGISPEREISLQSGKAVANALRETNNNVIEIIVKDERVDELDNYEIDVAFIALHGRFGEDRIVVFRKFWNQRVFHIPALLFITFNSLSQKLINYDENKL